MSASRPAGGEFAARFRPGRWVDVPAAGRTLNYGAKWLQRDDLRRAARWSPRWWLAGYLLSAGWVVGWAASPLLVAGRRLLPGGGWIGGPRATMFLTRHRRSGRWTISDFCARPVGAGLGRPLLARVCAAADTAGVGLRLVAHTDTLAAKVYAPAGFVTVARTRWLGMPVMHRDPKPAPADGDQTAPSIGLVPGEDETSTG